MGKTYPNNNLISAIAEMRLLFGNKTSSVAPEFSTENSGGRVGYT
jgi:hypothetical protein